MSISWRISSAPEASRVGAGEPPPAAGDLVKVLDHGNPDNNDFPAVNQLTEVKNRRERRPDMVVFVNLRNPPWWTWTIPAAAGTAA